MIRHIVVCICNGDYDSITAVYLVTAPNILRREVLSWPDLLRIGGVEEDSTHVEFLTPSVVHTIKSVCARAYRHAHNTEYLNNYSN